MDSSSPITVCSPSHIHKSTFDPSQPCCIMGKWFSSIIGASAARPLLFVTLPGLIGLPEETVYVEYIIWLICKWTTSVWYRLASAYIKDAGGFEGRLTARTFTFLRLNLKIQGCERGVSWSHHMLRYFTCWWRSFWTNLCEGLDQHLEVLLAPGPIPEQTGREVEPQAPQTDKFQEA